MVNEKLKLSVIEKLTKQLNVSSNEELADIAQDYNDTVGTDIKDALETTIDEYKRGVISHLSLLKQTEGIVNDFKDALIDANLFAEYVK
jgi:uncharacterized protein YecA (UPF0149 family)